MDSISGRLAALIVVVLCAADAAAENVTLNTYYPAPSGVYTQMIVTSNTSVAQNGGSLTVGSPSAAAPLASNYVMSVNGAAQMIYQDFYNYKYGTGTAPPPPPFADPATPSGAAVGGRLFYDSDSDQFYSSSINASPSDSTTWYKPVSGFSDKVVAAGGLDQNYETDTTSRWLGAWGGVSPKTALAAGNAGRNGFKQAIGHFYLQTPKTTTNGLYLIEITGAYCTTNETVCSFVNPASGDTYDLSPTFKVYYNNGSWHAALAQTVLLSPVLGPTGHYCDQVDLQTMAFIGRGAKLDFAVQVMRTAKTLRPLCKPAGKLQPDEMVQSGFTLTATSLLTF